MTRTTDGSAGDRDYAAIGSTYSRYRRPDPAIAAQVRAALGDARTVLNVGAGTGSYEPTDLDVMAVEPSATMRAQRPAGAAPCVDAVADDLPFDDDSFDAAMATVTVHQWPDVEAGLAELRRVTRGPIVLLTFDGDRMRDFWLNEYAPALFDAEAPRFPSVQRLCAALDGTVSPVAIPWGCTDGFMEAYYGRPEMFLDPAARLAQSAWAGLEPDARRDAVERLRAALESGEWDVRHGHLRSQPSYEGSLVIVAGQGGSALPQGARPS